MNTHTIYGACRDCNVITHTTHRGEWLCGDCRVAREKFERAQVPQFDQLANTNRLHVIYAHRGGRY